MVRGGGAGRLMGGVCVEQVRQEPGLGCAGRWFCFDDTSVEPWDIAHLERDCFGGRHIPETGYYSSKMQVSLPGPSRCDSACCTA